MRTSGMSGAGGGCYRGEVMSPEFEAATHSGNVLDPRRGCLVLCLLQTFRRDTPLLRKKENSLTPATTIKCPYLPCDPGIGEGIEDLGS